MDWLTDDDSYVQIQLFLFVVYPAFTLHMKPIITKQKKNNDIITFEMFKSFTLQMWEMCLISQFTSDWCFHLRTLVCLFVLFTFKGAICTHFSWKLTTIMNRKWQLWLYDVCVLCYRDIYWSQRVNQLSPTRTGRKQNSPAALSSQFWTTSCS